MRKEAGFAVSDKVLLDFETTSPTLTAVILDFAASIMQETLSEIQQIQSPLMTKEIKLDECPLTVKTARKQG